MHPTTMIIHVILQRSLRGSGCSSDSTFRINSSLANVVPSGPLYIMINAKELIHMCNWSLINKDFGVKWHIQMLWMNTVCLICVLGDKNPLAIICQTHKCGDFVINIMYSFYRRNNPTIQRHLQTYVHKILYLVQINLLRVHCD